MNGMSNVLRKEGPVPPPWAALRCSLACQGITFCGTVTWARSITRQAPLTLHLLTSIACHMAGSHVISLNSPPNNSAKMRKLFVEVKQLADFIGQY